MGPNNNIPHGVLGVVSFNDFFIQRGFVGAERCTVLPRLLELRRRKTQQNKGENGLVVSKDSGSVNSACRTGNFRAFFSLEMVNCWSVP